MLPRVTQLAGFAAMAIGVTTLIGWWLGVGPMTYIRAGWRTMKPATALLCMLAGLALVMLGAESARERAGLARARGLRTARNLCGALCGAIALVALLGNAFGFKVPIDVLLTRRTVGMPLGRTGLSYLLISAGILLADKVMPHDRSPTQYLGLTSASIALVALLGYAFSLPTIHGPAISTVAGGMALENALSIFLLSVGLVLVRPDVGTGLGLYIAKGLVEAHGGHIWVDSAPGELTTFHFVVPRASPLAYPPLDAGTRDHV